MLIARKNSKFADVNSTINPFEALVDSTFMPTPDTSCTVGACITHVVGKDKTMGLTTRDVRRRCVPRVMGNRLSNSASLSAFRVSMMSVRDRAVGNYAMSANEVPARNARFDATCVLVHAKNSTPSSGCVWSGAYFNKKGACTCTTSRVKVNMHGSQTIRAKYPCF